LGCVSIQDSLIRVYDNYNFPGNDIEVNRGTVIISNHLLDPKNHGRMKYTYAHELGHWELHKNTGIVLTRCKSSIGKWYRPKTDAEWLEWQADCFAASLLMPAETFKNAFQRMAGQTVFSIKDYVIPYMAQTFQVSKQAAAIRARHLFLV
jgi:Zn-dependent peptidase ImmA (M78 family)